MNLLPATFFGIRCRTIAMVPFDIDPIYLFFVGLLLAFVLGSYLFLRRVILSFRRGIDEGRR